MRYLLIAVIFFPALLHAQPDKIRSLEAFSADWTVESAEQTDSLWRVTYSSGPDTLIGFYDRNDDLNAYRATVSDTLWIKTPIYEAAPYVPADVEQIQAYESMPDADNNRIPDLIDRWRMLQRIQNRYETR